MEKVSPAFSRFTYPGYQSLIKIKKKRKRKKKKREEKEDDAKSSFSSLLFFLFFLGSGTQGTLHRENSSAEISPHIALPHKISEAFT